MDVDARHVAEARVEVAPLDRDQDAAREAGELVVVERAARVGNESADARDVADVGADIGEAGEWPYAHGAGGMCARARNSSPKLSDAFA